MPFAEEIEVSVGVIEPSELEQQQLWGQQLLLPHPHLHPHQRGALLREGGLRSDRVQRSR